MSPPTIVQSDVGSRTQRTVVLGLAAVVAALAGVVGLNLLVGLSAGPATITRITFVNPTPYSLDIEVSSGTRGGWVSAGFVAKMSTAVVEEVPDQGDAWTFRFDGQGERGGELQRTRDQLKHDGWRVEVPAEIGQHLAELGAPPTP